MVLLFHRSTQLNTHLMVKLGHLEGVRERLPLSEVIEDPAKSLTYLGSQAPVSLIASVSVVADAKPLTVPVFSSYHVPKANPRWNEWIELPISISSLPASAYLLINVWGPSGGGPRLIYGGTTFPLFDKSDGTLRQGRQRLKLWIGHEANGLPQSSTDSQVKEETEMDRLEGFIKKHQAKEIPAVDWLDNLVFRKIEMINKDIMTRDSKRHDITIEMPIYEHDVVFDDHEYALADPTISNDQQLAITIPVVDDTEQPPIAISYDPDYSRETPIETKYRRLVRLASDDKDFRPNAKIRDELESIIKASPVHELSSNEKNLVWKYRYYLTKHKDALTKFVKSVAWDDTAEEARAALVLKQWVEIDVAAALELLGPDIQNSQVRAYAVDRLRTASDRELELFLLELVEALKFEHWQGSPSRSYLARFLVNRALLNEVLGNSFYWYVSVQTFDRKYGTKIYLPILKHYLNTLPSAPNGDEQVMQVKFQVKFINKMLELAKLVKQSKEPRPKRIQQLRDYISDPRNDLLTFLPTKLPLDPTVTIDGCVPEECSVFKSTMQPLLITLKVQGGGKYRLIFKSGDDLRQDQLVIQIIELMNQLLQNENLDLKLMPYRILATSPVDGAMQFVANETLANVLSEYHGILPFLRKFNADDSEPLGVKADVMDNFVRSSAGYAVITYLLGVGDRHLENLLITPEGQFFHIDFGYILGRDPKPFPPVIKLPIQLIDGMGGINSENYIRFRSYCFTAFTTLRRSANLILALFNLMTESTIPNIMMERGQAGHKVEERFCLDMTEEEAILHFQSLINDSVNAFMPMVIDRLHSLAQYWRA